MSSAGWIQAGSPAAPAVRVPMEGKGAGTPGGQVSVLCDMGGFWTTPLGYGEEKE